MRKLYCYVHTHWDREWYRPFESFRMQLVPVVRRILDGLERDDLPRFYLDGQAVIFEDVFSIDETLKPRVAGACASGKLSAGPWYVLADQMLVSGESLIRNLHYGLRLTRNFGTPAAVGYCPDTFGHSQDLPRILRGFNINNAFVWRGVPKLPKGPLFRWTSPDGSNVLAYHLTRGYYQTAFHEALADGIKDGALGKLASEMKPWIEMPESAPVLVPIGADHVGPPAGLQPFIGELNEVLSNSACDKTSQIIAISLPDFVSLLTEYEAAANDQQVHGELRCNSTAQDYERAYLLYGVLSTRLYLKRANRLAEYALSRQTEPLFAILRAAGIAAYPYRELDHAWKVLLKNSAHDSICGCSVDEVHRQMMDRSESVADALSSLADSAQASLVGSGAMDSLSHRDPSAQADSLVFFNTSGEMASAPVKITFAQAPDAKPAKSNNIQVESVRKGEHLFAGWGAVPYYKEVDLVDAWVWAEGVPALGMAVDAGYGGHGGELDGTSSGASGKGSNTTDPPPASPTFKPVTAKGNWINNELLEVHVSHKGKITVSHLVPSGQQYKLGHRLQDVADVGDTYNFDCILHDRPIEAAVVEVIPKQRGPLVASIQITYEIEIPECAVRSEKLAADPVAEKIEPLKRSKKRIKHLIQTTLSLRKGVPIVFFETEWNNLSSDHRLEVVFETGDDVLTTQSENHFSVVERSHGDRSVQKLPVPVAQEALPDRFPAQRFFIANEQLFLNTGLPEYGVDGSTVSLTLLRAVSWLSKPRLHTRGGGAGPNLEVPEANCIGVNKCSYGWAPLAVPQATGKSQTELSAGKATGVARAYRLAELYEGPLWVSKARRRHIQQALAAVGIPAQTGRVSLATVSNQNIRVVACFCSQDDTNAESLVLRLLNVSSEPQICELSVGVSLKGAYVSRLDGGRVAALDYSKSDELSVRLDFGVNELMTLRVPIDVTNVSSGGALRESSSAHSEVAVSALKKPAGKASSTKRRSS